MEPFTVRLSRKVSCLSLACAPAGVIGSLFVFMPAREDKNVVLLFKVLQVAGGSLFLLLGVVLFLWGIKNMLFPRVLLVAASEGLVVPLHWRVHGSRRVVVPWSEVIGIEKHVMRPRLQRRGTACFSFKLRNHGAFRADPVVDKALKRNTIAGERNELNFPCFHFAPNVDESEKRIRVFLDLYGRGPDVDEPLEMPLTQVEQVVETMCRTTAGPIFVIIFSMFLVAGLASAGVGIWFLVKGDATRNWPRAKGRIISSEVEKTGDEADPGYSANIRYEYLVNGKKYESDRVTLVNNVFDERGNAEELAARYPAGGDVSVYYKASGSGESVLEPGRNNSFFGFVVFGVGALGVCLLLYRQRPWRRQQESGYPPRSPHASDNMHLKK